ncbi:MAG: LysR family transcriptional regulator [Bacillota bacterium]
MNLLKVESFLSIIEYNSISKAADMLFISQSTLSSRLVSLETEVGHVLINRNRGQRHISLTQRGEEFLLMARKWKTLNLETQKWIDGETSQILRIGSVDSLNIYVLATLFKMYKNKNPWVSLNVSTHWSTTIHNFLDTHQIDIGIVPQSIRNNNLISEPIFSENMVVISNSLLSSYPDTVSPELLNSQDEVFFNWGPAFIMYHDNLWNPSDNPAITVDTPGLIIQFMNIKNRWAIVTESVAQYLKETYPLKTSFLNPEPPKRISYKLIHRVPVTSSLKSISTFNSSLLDYISNHPHLSHV